MEEIWTRISHIHESLFISNYGRVKSIRQNGKEKMLKADLNSKGYDRISVTIAGKSVRAFIHRLVAVTFLTNEEGKSQVNHKDGNKRNNHVDNLEWATPKENMRHAVVNKLQKPRPSTSVIQYLDGAYVATYKSISDAAKANKLHPYAISSVCKGVRKSAGGYTFKAFQKTI